MIHHINNAFWICFCIILVLLAIAPFFLPPFWQRFLTEILIWGLLAMSSDILIGYTGMISFGHSAFFGLGMYGAAAALLTVSPPNLWLAVTYMGSLVPARLPCSWPIFRRACATYTSPSRH